MLLARQVGIEILSSTVSLSTAATKDAVISRFRRHSPEEKVEDPANETKSTSAEKRDHPEAIHVPEDKVS